MTAQLFTIPEIHQGLFCRDCKNCQRWQCNSKVFFYCGVRRSKLTSNGLLKIKCKQPACGYFEKETKE